MRQRIVSQKLWPAWGQGWAARVARYARWHAPASFSQQGARHVHALCRQPAERSMPPASQQAGRRPMQPTCSPISSMLFIKAATFSGSAGKGTHSRQVGQSNGSWQRQKCCVPLQPTVGQLPMVAEPWLLTIAARALQRPPDGRHGKPHHLQGRAGNVQEVHRSRLPIVCSQQ